MLPRARHLHFHTVQWLDLEDFGSKVLAVYVLRAWVLSSANLPVHTPSLPVLRLLNRHPCAFS